MNAKNTLSLFVALAALATPAIAADGRLGLNDLPTPVRKTLDASRGDDPVREINRRTIDGQAFYDIEIERNNAPNPHLRIAEDGTLMGQPVTPYVSSGDMPVITPEYADATALIPRMQLSDLPGAVQDTARTEASGREVADIDRETWNGRTVYEIEFRERGLNSRVYIAEDGTVVRDERRGQRLKSLFMGTQLEDTPRAVQQTVRRIAGDREVVDIDKKGTETEPVYRIELRDRGGVQELRVARDGRVLHDSRATRPSRGE